MSATCRRYTPVLLALMSFGVHATEVSVLGLMGNRAIISINGGKQKMLVQGQTSAEGVKLLAVGKDSATLEIDGKLKKLGMGEAVYAAPEAASSGAGGTATLTADGRGHFFAPLQVNGVHSQALVDTGASLVSFNANEAKRLGISYLEGQKGLVSTANGMAPIYRVRIKSIKLGTIVMYDVDASVHEGASPQVTLLGMSFLNRLDLARNGDTMVLTKRY